MRRAILGFALSILAPIALAQSTQPVTQKTEVPVKAVVLFSSGVGYFEHFGTVTGDGSTQLLFKTQQINDILKSLVLQDMDGGKVTTITYPSQDPIAKTLKSFQVDITSNPSLGELLNQLRGAKVEVATQDDKEEGIILGVEKKRKPVEKGEPIEEPVLNLLSGSMVHAVDLNSLRYLKLDDPQLEAELHKALSALAQSRDQDKKPVTINFTGQGERHVRIGYVVESPIWKTSYRLILSGAGAAASSQPTNDASTQPAMQDGKLQGWAIVENQTDNDWNNVQLSLVSGRPISFIQNLYQPLYMPRPVVQPQLFASLTSQTYEGGITERPADRMRLSREELQNIPQVSGKGGYAPATAPQADVDRQISHELNSGDGMDDSASIQSIASAGQIGELFEYTVGNVSLPRQKSAMLPIITDNVEIERLSIYNPGVLSNHPLSGARIKNTTGKHLLQGPITVIDGTTYAGDAQIDNVPPGQERLISFGIDLQMVVDTEHELSDNHVQTGKIVKGVLQLQRKHAQSVDYVAENKSDREKTLIIEHVRQPGWTLVEPAKPYETVNDLYRFKGKVGAGQKSSLAVKEEWIESEQVELLPCNLTALLVYQNEGQIPQPVRDALTKVIQSRQAMADSDRQVNEQNEKLKQITDQQSRIRENMKSVDKSSQYYTRLLGKLNDQETEIEKLQTSRDELIQQRDDQRKQLEDYLKDLTIG